MTLVVATTNPGKIREIAGMLHDVPVDLAGLDRFPDVPPPDETGTTFAENARIKALAYQAAIGLPCAAEDSGIEIAALDNAPGVESARWYGDDYAVKFRKIYELLAERGLSTSPARFVCRTALARDGQIVFESEGIIEGQIADRPRGTGGFGYDPIFYYPPFGCTTAELDLERKAAVSHRGRAVAALREFLLHGGLGP